ncbi:induced myeloid leukemia cell differentiation protein Mcl-1 [Carlito syrichta]|uniref:Induced myeloid leukemia cell differentiation protein Mcl-1 n=2 Tax=Boreoeutheria TaxID=1437010 RepID=A0A3Q0DR67_CARSF|nr:induced myeloid leukemia cell differentiation protein Mcl-1 [Carlito syrichta]
MFGLKRNAVIGLNLYCGERVGVGTSLIPFLKPAYSGRESLFPPVLVLSEMAALLKGRNGWDVSLTRGRPEFRRAPHSHFPAVGGQASRALAQTKEAVRTCMLFFLSGMLRKLDIKNEDDVKSLSRVMVHVFSDGVTNWGRIVTLISFGAFVAKHLKSINQESCIEPLAESITDVLVRTKRDWLVKQRGWDGFVEFFHVEDLEGGIRNVLLAFAGVAGVGAGLAYLIR